MRVCSTASIAATVAAIIMTGNAQPAAAWGDEGHKVVALVADHFLDPAVRQKVQSILAEDSDTLTGHDIAEESVWADHFRDSDRATTKKRYLATRRWHRFDQELSRPDPDAACFGHPKADPKVWASRGPTDSCLIDKIKQFTVELSTPETPPAERLIALKYILHLVGDVHEPMNVIDNKDGGGAAIHVTGADFKPTTLQGFWERDVIEEIGDDPKPIAEDLISSVSQSKVAAAWSLGSPLDWAQDAFRLARNRAYGQLPMAGPDGSYELKAEYVTSAIETTRTQMAKAGVRLAAILNRALAK